MQKDFNALMFEAVVNLRTEQPRPMTSAEFTAKCDHLRLQRFGMPGRSKALWQCTDCGLIGTTTAMLPRSER